MSGSPHEQSDPAGAGSGVTDSSSVPEIERQLRDAEGLLLKGEFDAGSLGALLRRARTALRSSAERSTEVELDFERRVAERTVALESANRQLQHHEKELQGYIDSMTTLTAKVAPDGRLLLVNRIALEASALPLDRLLKTNFLDGHWWTFDDEVHHRVRAAFQKACSGERVNYDEHLFAFGRIIAINFSLVPVCAEQGDVTYIVAEGRDITALKEAEAALAQRGAQLEAANAELEAFNYSVSHDLRAPLRAIRGFTAKIAATYGATLPEDAHQDFKRVIDAAARMTTLIEALLDLAKLSRDPLSKAALDLSELANSIVAELKTHEPQREVNVTIARDLRVFADPNLMRVAMENLLGNAWKFTRTRKPAEIELSAARRGGEWIFCVRDNGVGFDMAYAGRLFSPFQRLHGRHEFEGTGVGLATVRRIIIRHGGRIWAEADVDKGAAVYFTLLSTPQNPGAP